MPLSLRAGLMRLRGWLLTGGIAGLLVAIAAGGAWWSGHRVGLAKGRAELAAQEAVWTAAHARELEAARADERRMQTAADAAKGALDDALLEINARDARLADLEARVARLQPDAAAARELRQHLANYANGARGAADTLAACQDRAASLAAYAAAGGEVAARILGRAGSLARTCARERDGFAAEVIACISGWPR
jgi:chromosome segregation ATPase